MPFAARYRAQLARHPVMLVTAVVMTAAALVFIADRAVGGQRTDEEAAGARTWPVTNATFTANPGDAAVWSMHARQAAASCPGLPPEVLVAIGHVETRLGTDVTPSSAGAMGPMQFLPATWATYGVDGDGDGNVDIMNPVDAVHAAARLLCAHGASVPQNLPGALWYYNHSHHYVEQVLRTAGVTV